MSTKSLHSRRHIQDFSNASSLEPHWGYADRVVPCTNDAGSCQYLDLVYAAHDRGMLYSGIFWITILAIVLVLAIVSQTGQAVSSMTSKGDLAAVARLPRALQAALRRVLLPEIWRPLFGRATRLQVVVLAMLVAYLTIWSFVGLTYQQWITPVKNKPGVYNTRTTLGPWSDRIGVLAFALTPLSILLATRESLLSILTGIPYQKFNFLHRWLGWIIFAQSALHTIGWCIVEIKLYQPQPAVASAWIVQTYMIWGIVAMSLLTLLVILSTPWAIRRTGYEFFRKAHYVLAMVYIGACWGHWEQLKCFLLPSLLLWFVDRGARLVRSALLHYQFLDTGRLGFKPVQAMVTKFQDPHGGDILRLDISLSQGMWHIGQHFYLCFADCSIWQSHPFTPLNLPRVQDGILSQSFVLRAKNGETKKLASRFGVTSLDTPSLTPVILAGGYGEKIMESISDDTNVLCIAGGTGITYVLPVVLQLASEPVRYEDRELELVWAVRHADDLAWIADELNILRRAAKGVNLRIRLFATRDCHCGAVCRCRVEGSNEKGAVISIRSGSESEESDSANGITCDAAKRVVAADMHLGRPQSDRVLETFIDRVVSGRVAVVASGPAGMISDVRSAVAGCNSAKKIWQGQQSFDVELICDDRMEW